MTPVTPPPTTLKIPWYAWFLAFAASLLLAGAILRVLTPPPTAPENAPNQWQGLVPGYSTLADVTQSLGEPLRSERTGDGIEYQFNSPIQALPHEVITNDQGVVTFIKQYVSYKDELFLSHYVEQYDDAELVLKDEGSRDSLDAHVFLDQGLVVLAHVADGNVEQLWYFEPTTKEKFLASWGKSLQTESELEPEVFTPPGENPN